MEEKKEFKKGRFDERDKNRIKNERNRGRKRREGGRGREEEEEVGVRISVMNYGKNDDL